MRHAFDLWARDDAAVPKRFVVLGRDYGSREDYGHGDLAVGAHVGVELFPLIARWLGPEQPEAGDAEAGARAVESIEERAPVVR